MLGEPKKSTESTKIVLSVSIYLCDLKNKDTKKAQILKNS